MSAIDVVLFILALLGYAVDQKGSLFPFFRSTLNQMQQPAADKKPRTIGLLAGLQVTAASDILDAYFWKEPVNEFAVRQPSNGLARVIFLPSDGMVPARIRSSVLDSFERNVTDF